MAAGRICTGFSKPYVAEYGESQISGIWVNTYNNAEKLARGVSVSIEPESSDKNEFFADNGMGESDAAKFTGGDLNLTVDSLGRVAERLIIGAPMVGSWITYVDTQNPPLVGVGFIARYQSDGVTTYVPILIRKCRFNQISTSAETQEEQINWQTQELTAKILKVNGTGEWKRVGIDCATEKEAENKIRGWFNLQPLEEA